MSDDNKKEENKEIAVKDLKTEDAKEEETDNDIKSETKQTQVDKEKDKNVSVDTKDNEKTIQTEVPVKFKKIVEEIEKMSVVELNELVKVFEKKFGVSAQAVAVAPAGGAAGGDNGAEEQSFFVVELTAAGEQKIAVIKVVKSILGLGLKEAKDAVDGAPSILKEGVKKEEAENIKKQIEEAGGIVTLK